MKRIIRQNLFNIFALIVFIFGTNNSFGQNNNAVAFGSEGEMGRCTGSSYCTACTNCSRCSHCNSGGACGVCSRGSTQTSTRNSNSKSKNYYYPSTSSGSNFKNSLSTSETYYLPNDIYSDYYLKTLMVNTLTLNLRKGPGSNYGILEKLSNNQELVFLAMTTDWVKVRVKSTSTIGYVHYKYVVIITE